MKLINLFLLLCAFQLGFSQQNYHEEWYSADTDDLPQNSIKSIISDKYGFIWMTTENGLLRYDGKKFKIFNTYNSNIKSNRLTYISGNIQNDSLKTKTSVNSENILITQRKIIISKGNNNFNTTNSYEDFIYYNNYLNAPNLNFIDSKIICQNENYYIIEKEKITLFDKRNKIIKAFNHTYQESTIYFLYENELVLLDYKNNNCSIFKDGFTSSYEIVIPQNSKIIYNHLAQQLFICTENEISLFKKIKNKVSLSSLFSKEKMNLTIKSLYFNPKNNKLFIGTIDKGLNIITPNRFRTLINQKNANNNYYGIYRISEQEFVTSRGEIFNLNGLVRNLNLNKNENENHYLITVDLQKNIWIPNGTKIIKYLKSTNYKTSQIITLVGGITSLYCDSKNKIWVGIENIFKKKTKVYKIDALNNKSELISLNRDFNSIVFITENKKNELLMASNERLIIYNQQRKSFKSFYYQNNTIRSIYVGNDNLVWICTYNNGFSLFKDNSFYKMPFDKKMYLLSAHCIEEDKRGFFWISTNKGMIEVNKQSLLNYIDKNTPIYYHHFDMKDGFLTNEFNGGCQPCSIQFNNQFIFPSLNGMVFFNPETIKMNSQPNDFYINEVELDEETLYFKDTIRIDRDIDRVKFKIDHAYFGNLDNVNFEVKLHLNSKEKWINLRNENEIIFTNLPPGKHKLYVRKIIPFTNEYRTKKKLL